MKSNNSMYDHLYLYIKEMIIKLNDSEFSFLISNNIGLYAPAIIALIMSPFIIKKSTNNIYAYTFCLSIFLTIFIHHAGYGLNNSDDKAYKTVNFISYFPLLFFLHILYMGTIKKIYAEINLYWMFIGTFSSMLFADVYLSITNPYINFSFDYIGGAGIIDGLIIAPCFALIGGITCNKLILYNLMKNKLT